MLKIRGAAAAVATAALLAVPASGQAETVMSVSGTGISLGIAHALGKQLRAAHPDIRVEVLPSMGSGGGLKALRDGVIDVSFSARKLKPEEAGWGHREAGCMRTPLLFATTRPDPGGLNRDELPALYRDPAPNWPDGSPLKAILRSRSGSELPYLAAQVPGLGDAFAAAFARPETAIGTTDQVNAGLVASIKGSVGIMSLMQVRSEGLHVNPLAIDGVAPSPATVADGSYPFSLRVCQILPKAPKPAALKFAAQLQSPAGRALIVDMGATPVE